jgi:hypothetical protein
MSSISQRREQTVRFHSGQTATFEIGPANSAGALVVCLGQNKWVTLARRQG